MSTLTPLIESVRERERAVTSCSQRDLCEYQIERLVSAGLIKYEEADPVRRKFPMTGLFLIVPPQPRPFDLRVAMALVEFEGRPGKSWASSETHHDLEHPHSGLTLLQHVEDGTALLGTSADNARAFLRRENRLVFRTWHGIVYAILFPWSIAAHGVYLLGSKQDGEKTTLALMEDGRTIVLTRLGGSADSMMGAASYGNMVTV